jgi:hypothetical protein
MFARQCLGSRRIPDLKTLRRETREWNHRINRDQVKINWTFDRKAAVVSSDPRGIFPNGHRLDLVNMERPIADSQ